MVRGACSSFLSLLLLAGALQADPRVEERERQIKRTRATLAQGVFGAVVLKKARALLGTPYVWGDKSGRYGFDCSGYTAHVFAQAGVTLTGSALEQYAQGSAVDKAGLLPGDLVFFLGSGSPMHVGIYEGQGRFLHAPGTGKRVQSSPLENGRYARRFVGARRLEPPEHQTTPEP